MDIDDFKFINSGTIDPYKTLWGKKKTQYIKKQYLYPSININKLTGNVSGTDELIKKKNGKPLKYSIRFHLYPGLTAVKTLGGDSILIQLTKNKSLVLTIKDEKIFLEKSIFLARNRILNNTCITVSGILVNKNKILRWGIKEKI